MGTKKVRYGALEVNPINGGEYNPAKSVDYKSMELPEKEDDIHDRLNLH